MKTDIGSVSLVKNACYNIIYKVLNVLFPLISAAYISRVLEPEGIGKVEYVRNIVSYFVMFAALGIPRYGTREIAKKRNNKKEEVNKLFSELFILNAVSTAVCSVGYFVLTLWMPAESSLIYVICGSELLFNFLNINWLYEGEEEYAYITGRSSLVKFIMFGAMILCIKSRNDYPQYALILCLGIGVNNIFNLLHARGKIQFVFHGLCFKRHMKPILVLLLSVVTAGLYNKVDITMLGMLSSEESVAYYVNAHKAVSVVLTFVTAVSAVFMPRLSYLYEHERTKFRNLVTSGTKIVLLLAIPCCTGLFLVSEDLIPLAFGDLFLPAVTTTRIMTILVIVIGIGDLLCYHVVISAGHESALIKSRIIAGFSNIVLNALLIPHYQHNGAAFASVVSECIVNGILVKHAMSIVKPQISMRYIISLVISAAIMSVAVLAVQTLLDNGILALLGSGIIGAFTYFITLVIMKNEVMVMCFTKLNNRRIER